MKIILVVDDDYLNVEKVRLAIKLQNIEHTFYAAYSGAEALEMLTREKNKINPDIILLDVDLPKMSAIEFLRIIKSYYSLRSIKIFMMISSIEEHADLSLENLDISHYIIKPLNFANGLSVGAEMLIKDLQE